MRTVVITGASGNLGRAVADAFASENVVLLDVRSPATKQRFIQTDLLDAWQANRAGDSQHPNRDQRQQQSEYST